jgi:hypothetical protein
VLGALSIGQYDFPILLGTSLLIHSLRKENVALTTLGAALLTFKPHVGALILLSALGWLIASRSNFGRGAFRSILVAGVVLFVSGFAADPAWVISYPKMLLNYQNEGNVTTCSECASLPVWLSRWFFGGSLANAMWTALTLLVLLGSLFYFIHSSLRSHELLLGGATLATLLASPYLYNYDFLLLLVPFAFLIHKGNLLQKIVVLLCYLIPTFALIIYGRNGNISLIAISVVMLLLLFAGAKNSVIDVMTQAAYNTNK